jgi:uncharacterized protein (UPF0332 family)
MKPQTSAFLDKARELLDQGNTMMDVHLNEAASRAAYLAAMHAAQALIFENTDEVTSSHKRVQSQFWMLTKNDPRADDELRYFFPALTASKELLITKHRSRVTHQR